MVPIYRKTASRYVHAHNFAETSSGRMVLESRAYAYTDRHTPPIPSKSFLAGPRHIDYPAMTIYQPAKKGGDSLSSATACRRYHHAGKIPDDKLTEWSSAERRRGRGARVHGCSMRTGRGVDPFSAFINTSGSWSLMATGGKSRSPTPRARARPPPHEDWK